MVLVPRFGTCIIHAHLLKVNTYIYITVCIYIYICMHFSTLYCTPFVFDMNVKNMNTYKIVSESKPDNSRI
jgi:hypothetical protein